MLRASANELGKLRGIIGLFVCVFIRHDVFVGVGRCETVC